MTSRNFKQSMVNQDQEIIFEVVKVSGSWVFPDVSSIVEATRGKNMYLRLTDDGRSDIFRLDSVKDGENAGETVFGFVGNGGMDLVELTATTDGAGVTTGTWEYAPGEGPAGEAIGNLGQPLQWKGPATVSELNTGITGIQPGWTYTLTDAGTLTDGSVVVDAGDEVAWTGTAWLKVGGDGGVKVFTGTYNPAASPADYSGMPNTLDIAAALNAGNDVVLMLTNPADSNVYAYRLVSNAQYTKRFVAIDNKSGNGGWSYMPVVLMTFAGPGNPWGWASARYLSQELRLGTITESDLTGGHCGVNNLNALTTMTLTSVNSVTMHTNDYNAVNNFAVQIDNTGNSNDVTIDVQHGQDSLKYSVAGGNTVGAGKYMQLTCVGSCWTLAEFTVPTP